MQGGERMGSKPILLLLLLLSGAVVVHPVLMEGGVGLVPLAGEAEVGVGTCGGEDAAEGQVGDAPDLPALQSQLPEPDSFPFNIKPSPTFLIAFL